MRSYAVVALLAGAVIGSPVPQDLDWEAIAELAPIPSASIPVVDAAAMATTVSVQASSSAVASVSSAVQADPTNVTPKMAKRDNSQCAVQPAADDTDVNFSNTVAFSDAASGAQTPPGWTLAYSNQNGSSQGVYGYMGYSVLDTYDVATCASRCDAVQGCVSYNVYFERDPSVSPTAFCSNPPSESVNKCVYYGGPVTQASATNNGQWRDDFHVVIAGSNGYVNNSIETPAGYQSAVALGNGAIQAPSDCNGAGTYMGVKIFTSGPFDASLCAAACSATSDYDRRHPPASGIPQTCQFFNTYVLYNGTQAVGQYCAMYNDTWPAAFATNVGQWRGNDHFSIGYSYAFSNSTGGADEPSACTNPSHP